MDFILYHDDYRVHDDELMYVKPKLIQALFKKGGDDKNGDHLRMDVKTLIIHPEKCNNCGDCETACISTRTSLTSPGLSCIRILSTENEDFFFPIACKQCENPPCMATCPKEAIYRDAELDLVLIDRKKCVGCGMCVSACPFGAMKLDTHKAKSYKCDLCGGDPECVKVCEPMAIEYQKIEMLKIPNMVHVAGRLARLAKP